MRGKFITFEGIDGAGKSTHIPFVVDLLKAAGHVVVSTREPGGTVLGEELRTLLLNQSMHVETETLLMFAARREHIDKVIEPALARGDWVVSDRFTDASFAYQGGGRHLPIAKLNGLEQWVHPHLQPDMTFLFDLPVEVAAERVKKNRHLDKFEKEQGEFFANTRAEYLRRAVEFPSRFKVIDSNRPIEAIRAQLQEIVGAISGLSLE